MDKNKPHQIVLFWPKYKLFPYERKLGIRECEKLFDPISIEEYDNHLIITTSKSIENIAHLTYFSHGVFNNLTYKTNQSIIEYDLTSIKKKQNTRYSVHGLHEYKGKFNPQIVRSILTVFGIKENNCIFDPFCGSGTTLVEAAQNNISSHGTDINPLAVFIANTKIKALAIDWKYLKKSGEDLFRIYELKRVRFIYNEDDPRKQYLAKWFPNNILADIECLKVSLQEISLEVRDIYLVLISNLLRDYSLQEPTDLRIRRRTSPFPNVTLIESLKISLKLLVHSMAKFQNIKGIIHSNNQAFNVDIRNSKNFQLKQGQFDFAITSPPYATALPYIDTQRLSLIWLNFIQPIELKRLESILVGSREFEAKVEQIRWLEKLIINESNLPPDVYQFCQVIARRLKNSDGFRKQAVPSLLYRYFVDMKNSFAEIRKLIRKDGQFALIVGHNHTMVGNVRTDIDTPMLLSIIGEDVGFKIHEITPLETYHRYGLNSLNAVQKESLMVFKNC